MSGSGLKICIDHNFSINYDGSTRVEYCHYLSLIDMYNILFSLFGLIWFNPSSTTE